MKRNQNWFENVENRSHPWPGLNWLTTGIIVSDVEKAVDFYTNAMNMIPISEVEDDDGSLFFARMRYRGINLTVNKERWDSDILGPSSTGQTPPFIFYLYVDDVKVLVEKMTRAGAELLMEPEETFWQDLRARLRDPFGYVWDIAQKVQ
ncbi:Uncharacterized conserved protein PhnB, glyoxalase superfamily [Paenibacillaceae bacterium GAS479]|nr:Uncharacterized conserved protein PhnB, glyoxalase superfamily [Paenibacillaceae bacterium GAS479]